MTPASSPGSPSAIDSATSRRIRTPSSTACDARASLPQDPSLSADSPREAPGNEPGFTPPASRPEPRLRNGACSQPRPPLASTPAGSGLSPKSLDLKAGLRSACAISSVGPKSSRESKSHPQDPPGRHSSSRKPRRPLLTWPQALLLQGRLSPRQALACLFALVQGYVFLRYGGILSSSQRQCSVSAAPAQQPFLQAGAGRQHHQTYQQGDASVGPLDGLLSSSAAAARDTNRGRGRATGGSSSSRGGGRAMRQASSGADQLGGFTTELPPLDCPRDAFVWAPVHPHRTEQPQQQQQQQQQQQHDGVHAHVGGRQLLQAEEEEVLQGSSDAEQGSDALGVWEQDPQARGSFSGEQDRSLPENVPPLASQKGKKGVSGGASGVLELIPQENEGLGTAQEQHANELAGSVARAAPLGDQGRMPLMAIIQEDESAQDPQRHPALEWGAAAAAAGGTRNTEGRGNRRSRVQASPLPVFRRTLKATTSSTVSGSPGGSGSHSLAKATGTRATSTVAAGAGAGAKGSRGGGVQAGGSARRTGGAGAGARVRVLAGRGAGVAAGAGATPTLRQLLRRRFAVCNLTDRVSPSVYWKLCGNQLRQRSSRGVQSPVVVYSFAASTERDASMALFHRQMAGAGHKVFAFNPLFSFSQKPRPEEEEEALSRDLDQEGGGPLLAALPVKPFGLGLVDGVKPVLKPFLQTTPEKGSQDQNPSTKGEFSIMSNETVLHPHNETGMTAPMLRLKTLMCVFKHAWIDVVQMDLRGWEIELCDARGGLLGAGSPVGVRRSGWTGGIPVGQFVVKFEESLVRDGAKRRHRCEKNMDTAGYKVAHRRPDNRMVVFAKMIPRSALQSKAKAGKDSQK